MGGGARAGMQARIDEAKKRAASLKEKIAAAKESKEECNRAGAAAARERARGGGRAGAKGAHGRRPRARGAQCKKLAPTRRPRSRRRLGLGAC